MRHISYFVLTLFEKKTESEIFIKITLKFSFILILKFVWLDSGHHAMCITLIQIWIFRVG